MTDLLPALKQVQAALRMMTQPDAIKQTSVIVAYAAAVEAEVAARKAIEAAEAEPPLARDRLQVGTRMIYASGETGEVCWLDEKWVLAYQHTPCRTPRMYLRAQCRAERKR